MLNEDKFVFLLGYGNIRVKQNTILPSPSHTDGLKLFQYAY